MEKHTQYLVGLEIDVIEPEFLWEMERLKDEVIGLIERASEGPMMEVRKINIKEI